MPALQPYQHERDRDLRSRTLNVISNLRESMDVGGGTGLVSTLTIAQVGGGVFATLVPCEPGYSASTLYMRTGGTATTFGSNNDGHWALAAYDLRGNLLAQSADQGIAAFGANTHITKALAAPLVVPDSDYGFYHALCMYPGTGGAPAVPTGRGSNPSLGMCDGSHPAKRQLSWLGGAYTGAVPTAISIVAGGAQNSILYVASW